MADVDSTALVDFRARDVAVLQRIIAVLVARTGNDRVEIGENELSILPAQVEITWWRNPIAFSSFVAVDLDPETIGSIHYFAEQVAREEVGDAEIVEPLAITAGA